MAHWLLFSHVNCGLVFPPPNSFLSGQRNDLSILASWYKAASYTRVLRKRPSSAGEPPASQTEVPRFSPGHLQLEKGQAGGDRTGLSLPWDLAEPLPVKGGYRGLRGTNILSEHKARGHGIEALAQATQPPYIRQLLSARTKCLPLGRAVPHNSCSAFVKTQIF